MLILGISCGHDANVCLLKDGVIVAHLEKERFTRKKHDVGRVDELIERALRIGNVSLAEVDYIASSVSVWPHKGVTGDLISGQLYTDNFSYSTHQMQLQNHVLPAFMIPHHVAHASYSFYLSPFKEADIISVDAGGHYTTATLLARGTDRSLTTLHDLEPSNIGALWSHVSKLIFDDILAAGKTMGLSSYGEPRFYQYFYDRYIEHRDGVPYLVGAWEDDGNTILSQLSTRMSALDPLPRDVAATVQQLTDDILLDYARILRSQTASRYLCLSGGVALNGMVNKSILDKAGYDDIFIAPGVSDTGLSLGCALFAYHHILHQPRVARDNIAYLSQAYDDVTITTALSSYADAIAVEELSDQELSQRAAQDIADGLIIGWYQGRGESGPRALGNRSILCDARCAEMKDIMNARVKHRESFRPFAPSVLEEHNRTYFDLDRPSPYMLLIANARAETAHEIPAVVHVDGTARVQTVTRSGNRPYYDLIQSFYQITGVPLILNTSFNVRGEPIVEAPHDALKCFLGTQIDRLYLGNYQVRKRSASA